MVETKNSRAALSINIKVHKSNSRILFLFPKRSRDRAGHMDVILGSKKDKNSRKNLRQVQEPIFTFLKRVLLLSKARVPSQNKCVADHTGTVAVQWVTLTSTIFKRQVANKLFIKTTSYT